MLFTEIKTYPLQMNQNSTGLPLYDMEIFGVGVKHIWVDELEGILEKYPILEFPHKQNFFMIMFVENAEGDVLIDDFKIRIDQAKTIIFKPNTIVSININRRAKGKIVCFTEDFFSLRYNNNVLYQFSFLHRDAIPYVRISEKQKNIWNSLFNLVCNEFHSSKRDKEKVLRSYINIVLFELDRLYAPNEGLHVRTFKHEKIQQFENLVNEHFIQHKLPSAYAEMLYVSPNYLNKLCKEETGQTAGDLIRKRVIIEAQRMLHYSTSTINEISTELGFDSASYFVTFFKKNTGLTPECFRKEHH